MNHRRLGDSDVSVSDVSLGCWTLGGLNWVNGVQNGWANVDEDEAIAAIHDALDPTAQPFHDAIAEAGRIRRLAALDDQTGSGNAKVFPAVTGPAIVRGAVALEAVQLCADTVEAVVLAAFAVTTECLASVAVAAKLFETIPIAAVAGQIGKFEQEE